MGKGKKKKGSTDPNVKPVARNKRAHQRFVIESTYEAGLVLLGTEVKSLREGRCQLSDAHAGFGGNELYLYNLHIGPYPPAGPYAQHDPLRPRKLLLHRAEIERLYGKLEQRGYTLVPLEVYFRGAVAKVRLGLARGKRQVDRREDIKAREAERDVARALKRGRR